MWPHLHFDKRAWRAYILLYWLDQQKGDPSRYYSPIFMLLCFSILSIKKRSYLLLLNLESLRLIISGFNIIGQFLRTSQHFSASQVSPSSSSSKSKEPDTPYHFAASKQLVRARSLANTPSLSDDAIPPTPTQAVIHCLPPQEVNELGLYDDQLIEDLTAAGAEQQQAPKVVHLIDWPHDWWQQISQKQYPVLF